jgi:hypothetical protein
MTPAAELAPPSASTRGDFVGHAPLASGATMVSSEILTPFGLYQPPVVALFRRSPGAAVVTTFISLRMIDEMLLPRPRQTATFADRAIVIGGMAEPEIEEPSVLPVELPRPTFRFTSGRRARRLPPRTPFVSLSVLDVE